MTSDELAKLSQISKITHYELGVNGIMILFCASLAKKWLIGSSLLEMGPAEGLSTQYLHEEIKDLEVVDASEVYLNLISAKLPGVKCHQSLFETFEPNRRYDNIYIWAMSLSMLKSLV